MSIGFEQLEILLVEDNPEDAEMTMRALRKRNLANHVHWVKDGEEALDYLFRRGSYENRPDHPLALILLDLKMPKLSGAETLQAIKSSDHFKSLPVVMLTSSRETQDLQTCYKMGANGYVVKPVDAKQFIMAISTLATYWLTANETAPS